MSYTAVQFQEPLMAKKSRILASVPVWTGLLIGLLAIVVPILWNIYTTKTGLTVIFVAHDQLISEGVLDDRFRLTFAPDANRQGEFEIPSLESLRIAVKNSGRRAIRPDDIETPLTLTVTGRGGRILSATTLRSEPPGIKPELRKQQDNTVEILLPMLNGGDVVEVSLLGQGIAPEDCDITCRIVGISEARQIDQTTNLPSVSREFGFLGWFVAATIGILLLMLCVGIHMTYEQSTARRRLMDAVSPLESATRASYGEVVNSVFSDLTSSVQQKVRLELPKFFGDDADVHNVHEWLIAVIRKDQYENILGVGFLGLLSLAGVVFLLYRLNLIF